MQLKFVNIYIGSVNKIINSDIMIIKTTTTIKKHYVQRSMQKHIFQRKTVQIFV